ncbi:MAG TPA: methyltransferase [Firmicutes bacterium]|nr:methyltransferase [Bacillota bacterium]
MEAVSQPLGNNVVIFVSENHRYGTDAILLADFAQTGKSGVICDLGTGCGIIPLIWCRNGFAGKIYGVDIMPEAVGLCRLSADKNSFGEIFSPICADLRRLKGILNSGIFDLVTMNPPYKRAGSGARSANDALNAARNEELCTIDDIAAAGKYLLKFGGRMCLCSRTERLTDTICAMRGAGIEPKRLRMVIQRAGRCPSLFLIEGRKGGRPGLNVMPDLIIEENGGWSEEMKSIYGSFVDK